MRIRKDPLRRKFDRVPALLAVNIGSHLASSTNLNEKVVSQEQTALRPWGARGE